MTLFGKNSKILITDNRIINYEGNPIHLYDLNGDRITSFNPGNKLTYPGAICVLTFSNQEEIFIANKEKLLDQNKNEEFIWKILVFQSNFKFKFEFIYTRISLKTNSKKDQTKLHAPDYMQIDNEFNNTRLYISDHLSNRITIYNTSNGEQIDQLQLLNPGNMIFSQDYFYVASIGLSKDSLASIFKIRKSTLEIVKVILNRDSYTKTYFLGFDPLKNIIMLAYDLTKLTLNKKLRIYYLVIDENGNTITRYLTDLTEVHDALALKNMICIINNYELRQLKFLNC